MFNFQEFFNFNNSTKDRSDPSKIYFIGVESPTSSFTSMKTALEKIINVNCPKCDDSSPSLPCKCKLPFAKFEKFFNKCIFPCENSSNDLLSSLNSLGNGKSVCGKILKSKDIGFKCLDCGLDNTCIICQECYEKSNHKGHRTILQANCAGCCDCGDNEAWKPEGNCTDHQGFKGNEFEKIELLPEEFKRNYYDNFHMIFYLFFMACEDFFTRCGMNKPSSKLSRIWRLIARLLKNVNNDDNVILNSLLFCLLKKGFPEGSGYKLSHECENREIIYLSNNKNKCQCSILENIFRFNILLEKENQKQISELCISLFGFYDFKQFLIIIYTKRRKTRFHRSLI